MKQVDLTSKVRHYEGLSKLIVQFSGLCLEKSGEESKLKKIWGYSSAGRAPALQAGGLRFDPAYLHQL